MRLAQMIFSQFGNFLRQLQDINLKKYMIK